MSIFIYLFFEPWQNFQNLIVQRLDNQQTKFNSTVDVIKHLGFIIEKARKYIFIGKLKVVNTWNILWPSQFLMLTFKEHLLLLLRAP